MRVIERPKRSSATTWISVQARELCPLPEMRPAGTLRPITIAESLLVGDAVSLLYYSMRTELVTTLKRQATELLDELTKMREPILITQHGVPTAYLVDVESYENLQRRLGVLEGIARGGTCRGGRPRGIACAAPH